MHEIEQRALADVIYARIGLLRRSAASVQRGVGVSSSAWANYFVQLSRDVPLGVLRDVATELGMTTGDLVRQAEAREAELRQAEDPTTAELLGGLSPRNRAAVEEVRPAKPAKRTTRRNRSAG